MPMDNERYSPPNFQYGLQKIGPPVPTERIPAVVPRNGTTHPRQTVQLGFLIRYCKPKDRWCKTVPLVSRTPETRQTSYP